ncbi:DUF4352 domain-containing protein [Streptococcus porcorum]|uniref:DUF4352 domain-containing protein n=1 Tax=Streptococcus porcorum TaxID=701526 RepID=A0ABV2JE99_9STRE
MKSKGLGLLVLSSFVLSTLTLSTTTEVKAESQKVIQLAKKNKKKEKTYKVGEVVTVKSVEYTVNGKELTTNVGGEFGATANDIFLVVDVTVKNNGKKALTISDDFFKLYKGETEYESDSAAGVYANQDSSANFFYSELNPGSTVTGKVVFDLTEAAANDPELVLQVQTGFWGTQTAKIALNQ